MSYLIQILKYRSLFFYCIAFKNYDRKTTHKDKNTCIVNEKRGKHMKMIFFSKQTKTTNKNEVIIYHFGCKGS